MGPTFRDLAEARSPSTERADRLAPAGASGSVAELPRAVRALARQTPVRTMAHVDALLALRRAAPRACTLAELGDAARVPPGTVARRCADDLVAAGLAARLDDRDA